MIGSPLERYINKHLFLNSYSKTIDGKSELYGSCNEWLRKKIVYEQKRICRKFNCYFFTISTRVCKRTTAEKSKKKKPPRIRLYKFVNSIRLFHKIYFVRVCVFFLFHQTNNRRVSADDKKICVDFFLESAGGTTIIVRRTTGIFYYNKLFFSEKKTLPSTGI